MALFFIDKLVYPLILGTSTCCTVHACSPRPLSLLLEDCPVKAEPEKGVNIPTSEVGLAVPAAYTDYRCCFGEET